jgi:hypothetical protein
LCSCGWAYLVVLGGCSTLTGLHCFLEDHCSAKRHCTGFRLHGEIQRRGRLRPRLLRLCTLGSRALGSLRLQHRRDWGDGRWCQEGTFPLLGRVTLVREAGRRGIKVDSLQPYCICSTFCLYERFGFKAFRFRCFSLFWAKVLWRLGNY